MFTRSMLLTLNKVLVYIAMSCLRFEACLTRWCRSRMAGIAMGMQRSAGCVLLERSLLSGLVLIYLLQMKLPELICLS